MEDDGAYGGDYEYMEGRELSSPTKDSIVYVYVFRWRVKWEQSSDEEVWLFKQMFCLFEAQYFKTNKRHGIWRLCVMCMLGFL